MTRLRNWVNHWTYCHFWGCAPEADGTWWQTRSGFLVVTPDTKKHCAKCGRTIEVEVKPW